MLIGRIGGMGGGQMYTNNKLYFVSTLGWDPTVFFAVPGEIVISELKKYENNLMEQMVMSPLVHSRKSAKKIIDSLAEKIGDFDEAVIESGSPYMALWGELLAARLNCKHMVHLLDERLDKGVPKEYLDFYYFKHGRKELSGINISSLKILFRNDPSITDDNAYHLSSVCSNVIVETDEDVLNVPQADVSLGCIGRLNKEFINPVINAFYNVTSKYTNKRFNVIFIGGSDNADDSQKIKNKLYYLDNVNLIMPGTLYPIPDATIKKVDLFVSSAGSARVSYRADVPTIAIDSTDLCPIGVLGYTTQNAAFRHGEPIVDLTDLIERILFEPYLEQFSYTPSPKVSLEPLKKHIEFLENSEASKDYFNVITMKAAGSDKKKRYIRMILGKKLYIKLRTTPKKIKK